MTNDYTADNSASKTSVLCTCASATHSTNILILIRIQAGAQRGYWFGHLFDRENRSGPVEPSGRARSGNS